MRVWVLSGEEKSFKKFLNFLIFLFWGLKLVL